MSSWREPGQHYGNDMRKTRSEAGIGVRMRIEKKQGEGSGRKNRSVMSTDKNNTDMLQT